MSALRAVAWGWLTAEGETLEDNKIRAEVAKELKPTRLRFSWKQSPYWHSRPRKDQWALLKVGETGFEITQGTFRQCCIDAVELLDGRTLKRNNGVVDYELRLEQ